MAIHVLPEQYIDVQMIFTPVTAQKVNSFMSVIQSTQPELRYLKRPNLKQEANIVGNWYRDIIRSYGIDVTYNKLDTSFFSGFNGIVDKNAIIRQAYGYDVSPDYSMSAHMLSYMEVENDIFQLNKFGLNPETTVNFYFDSIDFACDLACKLGQYEEIKIDERLLTCEVPEMTNETITDEETGNEIYLSASSFPYKLGVGLIQKYTCKGICGNLYADIQSYQYGVQQTVQCYPMAETIMMSAFSANPSLYKAFKHQYQNDDMLDTFLTLTFTVSKRKDVHGRNVSILSGKLKGSLLFYNLNKIGKYVDMIHPEVGDIVTIDFPDDANREQYEITDAFDKQLTNDGISPLLHKYIWKCKARRYINNYDSMQSNEANDRLQEKLKLENAIETKIKKEVELYTDNQDAVYGGYDNKDVDHDMMEASGCIHEKYDYIEDGTAIDILKFADGSKLVTTGYELLYVDCNQQATKIATEDEEMFFDADACPQHGMKWLKANKDMVVYTNIEGKSFKIAEDFCSTDGNVAIQLDSFLQNTIEYHKQNQRNDNFYKFSNCKTVLFSLDNILYCKLESNNKIIQLT